MDLYGCYESTVSFPSSHSSSLLIHSFLHTHIWFVARLCITYVIIGRIWVLLFTLISTVVIHVDLHKKSIGFIHHFIHFSDNIPTYLPACCVP